MSQLPFQLRWREAIADDPDVSQSAVVCAHTLSLWMNARGRCSPGIAEIARRMHCHKSTAQRACRELEEAKYLEVRPNKGYPTRTGKTNLYQALSRGSAGATPSGSRGSRECSQGVAQCDPNSKYEFVVKPLSPETSLSRSSARQKIEPLDDETEQAFALLLGELSDCDGGTLDVLRRKLAGEDDAPRLIRYAVDEVKRRKLKGALEGSDVAYAVGIIDNILAGAGSIDDYDDEETMTPF
jgi:hypothetical protein